MFKKLWNRLTKKRFEEGLEEGFRISSQNVKLIQVEHANSIPFYASIKINHEDRKLVTEEQIRDSLFEELSEQIKGHMQVIEYVDVRSMIIEYKARLMILDTKKGDAK